RDRAPAPAGGRGGGGADGGLSARVLRPLRSGLRALRRLHRRGQARRPRRRLRLPGPPRPPASRLRRVPGQLRHVAVAGPAGARRGADGAVSWTPQELMTVSASCLLRDRGAVFAGVGVPLLASVLAKRRHAPDLTIVLEGGIIGPRMLGGQPALFIYDVRRH